MNLEDGLLLRIFIGEQDRYENAPLHEWVVSEAHRQGLAGATVLRGLEGFGADSRVHSARVMRLSTDLPLVVELIDRPAKIEAFLEAADRALSVGLLTVEKVRMKFYRENAD